MHTRSGKFMSVVWQKIEKFFAKHTSKSCRGGQLWYNCYSIKGDGYKRFAFSGVEKFYEAYREYSFNTIGLAASLKAIKPYSVYNMLVEI